MHLSISAKWVWGIVFERPKSAIFTCLKRTQTEGFTPPVRELRSRREPVKFESKSRFSGFRSRWVTCLRRQRRFGNPRKVGKLRVARGRHHALVAVLDTGQDLLEKSPCLRTGV